MWKKVVLSLVLAAALIALAFTVVDREKFAAAMGTMRWAPVVPIVGMYVFVQLVRVVRWWLIVGAVKPITMRSAMVSALAGFMAINVFPLRTGEIVRPWVLKSRDGMAFTSGIAAVVAERVVDAIAVFALLLASLAVVPARVVTIGGQSVDLSTVARTLMVLLAIGGIGFVGLIVLRGRFVSMVERVLSPVPKLASIAGKTLGTFVEGLEVFTSPMRALQVSALTLVIWGGTVVSFWIGFALFEIGLPISAAMPVLAITMAGITVPGGIGMSGNFQIFCMGALLLYPGVDEGAAFAYSVVMNVLSFIVAVGMGLFTLPFLEMKLTSMVQEPT